jgi:hypothetical protein
MMQTTNMRRVKKHSVADRMTVICLLAAMALMVLSITRQSIWIDEFVTYRYAAMPSWGDWLDHLLSDRRSEAQMPLGMAQSYGFAQLFGLSEVGLRAPNLLWLFLGLGAFAALGRRLQMPWLPLVLAVHPMVWFYADEARPYAMQIGLSSVLLYASVRLLSGESRDVRAWTVGCLAALGLCGASLMAAIVFAVWLAVLLVFVRPGWQAWPIGLRWITSLTVGVLGLLAVYFSWTVLRGSGGSRIWTVGVGNIAFAGFEFVGGTGFTPGRIALREAATQGDSTLLSAIAPYSIPLLLLGLVIVHVLFWGGPRVWRQQDAGLLLRFMLIVAGAAATGLIAASFLMAFPFWGRHLIALFPLFLLMIALMIQATPTGWLRYISMALIAVWLTGSLYQRFHPLHQKDDYRWAATLAQQLEAEGLTVLWIADHGTASYYAYEPDLYYREVPDNPAWRQADVIFYSKGNIYDPQGIVAAWLHDQAYSLRAQGAAFTVWQRGESG